MPTQDGRPLRRYGRRWRVERLFAWLHHFRRLVIRWEYHVENFFGMVRLGACKSSSDTYEWLLVSQRHHRVDFGRTERGDKTRQQSNDRQDHGDGTKD